MTTHPYRFCPKCNKLLVGDEVFCAQCGFNFSAHAPRQNSALKILGIIIIVLVGIYATILEVVTLNVYYGLTGVICGILIFPIAGALVPIYWLINGYWWPAIIIYGGGILASILYGAGGGSKDT